MPLYTSDEDVGYLQKKVGLLLIFIFLFLFIVVARLLYLQVIKGPNYRILSDQISVREEEIRAKRGLVLDRNGKVLADNRSIFEIVAIPQDLKDKEETIKKLTELVPLTTEEINEKLKMARGQLPFFPVVLASDVPYDWVAKISEYNKPTDDEMGPSTLPGIEVRRARIRRYLYPDLFSHVIGYLKEVDRENLEKLKKSHGDHYSMGDLVGTSGLETTYDEYLKGTDGVLARVVDARGKEIRNNPDVTLIGERANLTPVSGYDLQTGLDFKAQEAASLSFKGRRGAAVALDPNTGEVIVLYSAPNFDGNRIIKNIDKPYWQKINLDPDKYLYNRAIQATYPPGSTYKMVTSLSGLSSQKINPETVFHCSGGLQFGNRVFHCWNKHGHGAVSLVRALTQSCDIFYYQTGLRAGVDTLNQYAHRLGLGEKTGIDLPYEKAGLIPTTDWKQKRFKRPWIESETLSISIGQGYDLVTPLQNALMVGIIANGGHKFVPHVVNRLVDSEGKAILEINDKIDPEPLNPEYLKWIHEGLIQVVHGQGTAGRLRASKFKIAGKTGTAQVLGYESKAAHSERTKDHALFVGYAPYDNPQIAVSVVVENGGHGGSEAGPVAMAIIDAYLEPRVAVDSRP